MCISLFSSYTKGILNLIFNQEIQFIFYLLIKMFSLFAKKTDNFKIRLMNYFFAKKHSENTAL